LSASLTLSAAVKGVSIWPKQRLHWKLVALHKFPLIPLHLAWIQLLQEVQQIELLPTPFQHTTWILSGFIQGHIAIFRVRNFSFSDIYAQTLYTSANSGLSFIKTNAFFFLILWKALV
jgi:hypothetical protein